MFKVGDMAVYPTHGVGIIESIESKEISGNKHTFYVLRVLGNGMTIMIPTNNAEAVGSGRSSLRNRFPRCIRF